MAAEVRATPDRRYQSSTSKQYSKTYRSTSSRLLGIQDGGFEGRYSSSSPSKVQQPPSSLKSRGASRENKGRNVFKDIDTISAHHTPFRLEASSQVDETDLSPDIDGRRKARRSSHRSSIGQQTLLGQTLIPESPTDHVNISGTTFLSIDSEHESLDFDQSSISDALPPLLSASGKVIARLAPLRISYAKIVKAFGDPNFEGKTRMIEKLFEDQKRCIINKHFIPVDTALPFLARPDWKVQPIWQKANLAQLALDMVSPRPNGDAAAQLSLLDRCFPGSFVNSFGMDDPAPVKAITKWETFHLGLEIRTQRLILAFKESMNDTNDSLPESILENIFQVVSIGDDFRGFMADGLKDEDDNLPEEFHSEVEERLDTIRLSFNNNTSSPVDIDSLDDKFPWSEFVIQIATWIRKRTDEIDQQLKAQEPVESVIKELQTNMNSTANLGNEYNSGPSPAVNRKKTPHKGVPFMERIGIQSSGEASAAAEKVVASLAPKRSFLTKASIRRLRERKTNKSPVRTIPVQQTIARSTPRASGSPCHDDPPRALNEEYPKRRQTTSARSQDTLARQTSPPQSQFSAQALFDIASEVDRSKKSKKDTPPRRTFIDRQDKAQRVSPINFSQEGPSARLSKSGVRKRTMSPESDDFEVDRRPTKQRRIQRRVPTPPIQRMSSSAPSTQSPTPEPSTNRTRTVENRNSRVYAESQPSWRLKAPRVQWSMGELNQLKRLIKKFGPTYARIEAEDRAGDNILRLRNQGTIRDKARQITFDHYKRNVQPPKKFEYVVLTGKMQKELEPLGVHFENGVRIGRV